MKVRQVKYGRWNLDRVSMGGEIKYGKYGREMLDRESMRGES